MLIKLKNQGWYKFIKSLYKRFATDDIPAIAAHITFHLILALFPFLIFVFTLAGYTSVSNENVLEHLAEIFPENTYQIIAGVINDVVSKGSDTLLSTSIIATIWISSGGTLSLIKGLNKAYETSENRSFWKTRGLAILYTIGLAVTITFAFIIIVFGKVISKNLAESVDFIRFSTVWPLTTYLVFLLTTIIILLTLYYFFPNKKVKVKEILPGTLFSTAGLITISFGFSFYVNNFNNYDNTYGALGGIIVLLLWLYWNSIILILGGEINAVLKNNQDIKS